MASKHDGKLERQDALILSEQRVGELSSALGEGVGLVPVLVGSAVSFVVALASIAFLLRFVAAHSIVAFVPYRVALGVVVLAVLGVQAL